MKWATVLFSRKGSCSPTGIWIGVFAWNSDNESVVQLQERVCKVGDAQIWQHDSADGSPGASYEKMLELFNHTLLDIPESFDLPALIDADEAVVYDHNNKPIISKAHPFISGMAIVRPSDGKVSDMGRWLSQADQYAKGPEGETEGPSGLLFLLCI